MYKVLKMILKILKKYFFVLIFTNSCYAQILIGQTAGFTGGASASVKEMTEGAQLYINSVNASGGLGGQMIKILSMDDKFDPKLSAENARILIEEKKVVALFLNRGTPNTEALFPILKKNGIALIAPSTGAMLLHNPVNRYIFNVRTSYQREAEGAVAYVLTSGYQKIAVVHAEDSFGQDALEGANKGFATAKYKPAGVYKLARDKPNFTSVVESIVKNNTQAVLWFGNVSVVSEGVKALRAAGSSAAVITLSNNASQGFIKSLGAVAEGVIVTQVFPNERTGKYAMVRQAQDLAGALNLTQLTPSMLEGFTGAKVLVEALKRSGKNPSREKIVSALEAMKQFDLGGLELGYSPTDHTGLDFFELSIIGRDGNFKR